MGLRKGSNDLHFLAPPPPPLTLMSMVRGPSKICGCIQRHVTFAMGQAVSLSIAFYFSLLSAWPTQSLHVFNASLLEPEHLLSKTIHGTIDHPLFLFCVAESFLDLFLNIVLRWCCRGTRGSDGRTGAWAARDGV